MSFWKDLRVLCLGGGGQIGREVCRQMIEHGADTIIVHDLTAERAQAAIESLGCSVAPSARTTLVPSGGNVFHPEDLGTWSCEEADRGEGPLFRHVELVAGRANDEVISSRPDLLERLSTFNMGTLTDERVRRSLLWRLVAEYRPQVIVDTINTATALGYRNDVIRVSGEVHQIIRSLLDTLEEGAAPLQSFEDCRRAIDGLEAGARNAVTHRMIDLLASCYRMHAFLNTAAISRYVQCLNAMFDRESAKAEEGGTYVPELSRYVKVHTTGLGGMGFNIRYTHGDRGAPGLSTRLLGKVCVAGSTLQLLLGLAHTPGRDVRVVVPATLVGWEDPEDFVVRRSVTLWSEHAQDWVRTRIGPLPEIDSEVRLRFDGTHNLARLLKEQAARVTEVAASLEVPYIKSGENEPYAIEDLTAVTALGQMGCVTKEEVAQAVIECVQGDSRYDALTGLDATLLLPTQSASVLRDKTLRRYRTHLFPSEAIPRPSVSLGNLGPTTAKQLYEIELIRSVFPAVTDVTRATPSEMLACVCGYVTGDEGGGLRRQILSLGIPIVLHRGLGQSEILLGRHLAYPETPCEWDRVLSPEDERVRAIIDTAWVDLSIGNMEAWHEKFTAVEEGLERESVVYHDWFDPQKPFRAGEFLGFYHSITGGNRKQYM
ncbi:hypothetical protein ACFL59_01830 [Planctomycetota bacterium]